MFSYNKERWKAVLPVGFAIFSMFFGSGNLVYPINAGRLSGEHFLWAALGLVITAVIMPLIGLIGVVLAKGDNRKYFSELPYPIYFTLIAMLTAMLGPFFIMPRCAMIAFGGISALYPMEFWHFSLFFLSLVGVLAINPDKVVGIIGKFLTPFKFGGIAFITLAGIYCAPCLAGASPDITWLEAMKIGAGEGYQTLDLVAAFFFSVSAYQYLAQGIRDDHPSCELFKRSILACLFGEFIIAIIYLCFVKLGAQYASVTANMSPELVFPFITKFALGKFALGVLAFTLFFACLATALIVADIFSRFLREEVMRNKVPAFISVILTTIIAFSISLVGFTALANFFVSILAYIYPALILFATYKMIRLMSQSKA